MFGAFDVKFLIEVIAYYLTVSGSLTVNVFTPEEFLLRPLIIQFKAIGYC